MTQKKIVNMRYKTFTLDDEQLIRMASKDKRFEYKYVPVVAYNQKNANDAIIALPQLIYFQNRIINPRDGNKNFPFIFSLYEFGTSLTLLRSYTSNKINSEELLSVKKAFRHLKRIVSQCSERVIADLCCSIILDVLRKNSEDEITFFIESPMSDKMLGRLGTLYLDLDRVTLVFLATRPSDLMTTVMSQHTGKIRFDIHRLMSEESNEFLGPYPGDSEDSLIQTYFFKPKPISYESGNYRPIRLDIFSQGLSRETLEKKKDDLQKLLAPNSQNTETDWGIIEEPRLLLPSGFNELKRALDKKKEEVSVLLDE